MTKEEIRLSNFNPETKVYQIARQLREQDKIDVDLWYAILELKDKHMKDILFQYANTEPNICDTNPFGDKRFGG